MFRVDTGKGGGGQNPFKVYLRKNNGIYQAGVENKSYLFKYIYATDQITLTNILNTTKTSGWLTLTQGIIQKVYLEGEVIGVYSLPSTADIKVIDSATSFVSIEHDGEDPAKQTKFRRVLSVIDYTSDIPVVIDEFTTAHLTMNNIAAVAYDSSGNNSVFMGAMYPTII